MSESHSNKSVQPLLLYDGVCLLCNGLIKFVLKADKKGKIHISPLQSDYAGKRLEGTDIIAKDLDSVVLIANSQVYSSSRAVLELFRLLGFPYQLLYIFRVVPSFIRDAIYRWIARNRYGWFGKADACLMPDKRFMDRFIED